MYQVNEKEGLFVWLVGGLFLFFFLLTVLESFVDRSLTPVLVEAYVKEILFLMSVTKRVRNQSGS